MEQYTRLKEIAEMLVEREVILFQFCTRKKNFKIIKKLTRLKFEH